MKILVTGAAGFIGSHLATALLAAGHEVVGVDCFVDYYPRARKERNLAPLRARPGFSFREADLATAELAPLLSGVEAVYHQAAQAGVRASWGHEFELYTRCNILATQRLLEAARERPLQRFVYASSSSVYGDAVRYPADESMLPRPQSPYGVSKLAAEHLCQLYARGFGVPTVSLRYFTVYGPGQRPDMAFYRLLAAARRGSRFTLYGDGQQTRDFTFITDIVAANLLALDCGRSGEVFNIGGGCRVTMDDVLALAGRITGRPIEVVREGVQKGDVRHTGADTSQARALLGYAPQVGLEEGLRRMWAWIGDDPDLANPAPPDPGAGTPTGSGPSPRTGPDAAGGGTARSHA